MMRQIVTWVRAQAGHGTTGERLARLVGRGWARLTYARHVEPTWLEVNKHDIPIAGLPDAFAGLRIVQMTDFHCSKHVTATYLQEAVDLTHQQNPDVIVLTGDFVHKGFAHIDTMAAVLGRLRAPLVVFAASFTASRGLEAAAAFAPEFVAAVPELAAAQPASAAARIALSPAA